MIGRTLGPYQVLEKLGEGGMGEVYRARDTKLQRDVAVKVLPEGVAADPERLARFAREAQALAALNHPNIAAVYAVEGPGLVMELVAGEDLSARIQRGPIPLAEALPLARQIADAIAAAHEAGIVHRDLKPANIKVRDDGTIKVLDFGLAKALEPTGWAGGAAGQSDSSGALANSPTMTSPAPTPFDYRSGHPARGRGTTQMGMILGTAAYMAPEQAKGGRVDSRADIWAFGAVLYEMLTGRRAFIGGDVTDLLAAVLRDAPDFAALPADTPPSIRRLLRRCLEKDPKKRLGAIGDARLELDELDQPPAARAPASRRTAIVVAAAALTLAGLAAAAAWFGRPAVDLPVRLLELPASVAARTAVSLSPDGTRVAYRLDGHLYVRALDALTSQDLGTVPASVGPLFWSPDSSTIGFWAESEIRSIPAAGGPVFVVCKVPATGQAIAAKWLPDGAIVFAVWRENVYSVPATGGTPVLALAIDPASEIDVHHISAAPDGALIVMIHQRSPDGWSSVLVDRRGGSGTPKRVVLADDQTINQVDYASPGFLIFDRQSTNAGLWVAPFSAGPIDLASARLLQAGARAADIADDGSLLFELPAVSTVAPVWIDRAGAESSIAGMPFAAQPENFALSPDGRRVAIVVGGEDIPSLEVDETRLIVRDLATGADTQLTFRGASGRTSSNTVLWGPSWFPSGDRILVTGGGTETERLFVQRADEATPARELVAGLGMGRITRDGRALAGVDDERGRYRFMYAPVSPDGTVGAPQRVFRDDEPQMVDFDLSPDGRLVVFTTVLEGRQRGVFLSEFPSGLGRWLVAEAATRPRFSPDGREIFYLKEGEDPRGQPTRTMMRRTVSTSPSVALGAAIALFDGSSAAVMDVQGYSVAPDGRRFLTLKGVAPGPGQGRRLIWMQNWRAAAAR